MKTANSHALVAELAFWMAASTS